MGVHPVPRDDLMSVALFRASLLLLLAAILSACGGGGSDSSLPPPVPAADQVASLTVSGYPHAVDVYQTAGATRAIVVLHGGGGDKTAVAYQLGMTANTTSATTATVNWAWLDAHKVMLVMPQGQHLASEPNATTWSNRAMNSGVDDVAFLQALAAKIRADYGISEISLMGHSMGGVMINRMWCESPQTFNAYVSLAGPVSASFNDPATPCQPGSSAAKPYLGIIGDSDEVMQTAGVWEAATWTVTPTVVIAARTAWDNNIVIGELHQQQARTSIMCSAVLDPSAFVAEGNVDTWSTCGGKLVLKRVRGGEHGVASLDALMGNGATDVMDAALAFVSQF